MINVNSINLINVTELKKRYDAASNILIIDVREQDEWDRVYIPKALHIPLQQISQQIQINVVDQNQPIFIYCHSGVRSLYAAHDLLQLGYCDVYSVEGGIAAWANAGYPVFIQPV